MSSLSYARPLSRLGIAQAYLALRSLLHRFLNAVEPGTEVPIDLWSTSDATRPSLSKLGWRSQLPRFISIPRKMRRTDGSEFMVQGSWTSQTAKPSEW